jgi:hypothetical protein
MKPIARYLNFAGNSHVSSIGFGQRLIGLVNYLRAPALQSLLKSPNILVGSPIEEARGCLSQCEQQMFEQIKIKPVPYLLNLMLPMIIFLTVCSVVGSRDSTQSSTTPGTSLELGALAGVCTVTKVEWAIPPEDSTVDDEPEYGYYWVNEDRSIWASAWWTEDDEYHLQAGDEGMKVGWFRPAGADLEITGQRIDEKAPPLEAKIPCCYPTRFQATGLYFPTEGCWEVTATAAESELSFVLKVEP